MIEAGQTMFSGQTAARRRKGLWRAAVGFFSASARFIA